MDRIIKITINLAEVNENTPTGEEVAQQLRDDFADGNLDASVTLETEYDE